MRSGLSPSRLLLLAVLPVALVACPTTTPVDAGVPTDAGLVADAGLAACSPTGPACTDASKRCYPVGAGTAAVCVTPGTLGLGAACTTVLGDPPECAGGAVCLNFYGARQCVGVCNVDAGSPACAPGNSCQLASGVPWGVCTPTPDAGAGPGCDVLGPACADGSKRCYPVGTGASAVCAAPGSLTTGAPCNDVLSDPPECANGAVCLNFYGARQCVGVCNVDAGSPACAPGNSCQAAFGVKWGVCTPPPADAGAGCDLLGPACADSSQRCYPLIDGTNVCARPGAVPRLGACTNTFGNPPECAAQNVCLYGQCIEYCNRDGGAPACTSGPCGNAEGMPWGICLQGAACDPLFVSCDSFLTTMSCYPVGTGTKSVCAPAGSVATGAACTTVLGATPECVAGSVCLNVGTSGGTTRKCTQVCNVDGGFPTCASGACQQGSGVPFGLCL
jgi:hypothetical protein